MEKLITCQGRKINTAELNWLNNIVLNNPSWSRHRITKYICSTWNWKTHTGRLKTFAARSFIDKLEKQELLKLPPIRINYRRSACPVYPKSFKIPAKHPINGILSNHSPLIVKNPIRCSYEDYSVGYYLKNYHYLGFKGTVGENIKYLIQNCNGYDIACLLFGSAAWKTNSRDQFIGWKNNIREKNLNFITNNTRFLILPWINIPNLASHILGLISRRIQNDWINQYAHPIHMLETFVDSSRFKGTCYKAANWILTGETTGRSRQDRNHSLSVPVKSIWVYPLSKNFKQSLCNEK
jgi:hypothetical protein